MWLTLRATTTSVTYQLRSMLRLGLYALFGSRAAKPGTQTGRLYRLVATLHPTVRRVAPACLFPPPFVWPTQELALTCTALCAVQLLWRIHKAGD